MPSKHLDELPSELKDELLDGSDRIFLAAFNSASEDGMDEDAARQVAWNSIKSNYQPSDDGKWHRKPEERNQTHKAITTGGN